MIPVTLHTDRLVLSIPTSADIDAIFEICQDPEVQRWTTVPSPYRREHAVGFVERVVAPGWDEGHETTWALRLGGELIGMLALFGIADGKAELGYWMSPAHRRRGLLHEACRAVVEFGFASSERGLGLGLERISWRALADNIGSASVARSLGFRFEGTVRLGTVGKDGARVDEWIAGLLRTDDRVPVAWSVLAN